MYKQVQQHTTIDRNEAKLHICYLLPYVGLIILNFNGLADQMGLPQTMDFREVHIHSSLKATAFLPLTIQPYRIAYPSMEIISAKVSTSTSIATPSETSNVSLQQLLHLSQEPFTAYLLGVGRTGKGYLPCHCLGTTRTILDDILTFMDSSAIGLAASTRRQTHASKIYITSIHQNFDQEKVM